MHPASRFQKKLSRKETVFTCEIFPPKGWQTEKLKEKIKILKPYVDAINVTDNQRAVMRLANWAVAKVLMDEGVEPVFQITGRDRNRLAIQSDLLGVYMMGIKTVLAMGGDSPKSGDHPDCKGVFDLDSIGILKAIQSLNNGKDLAGNSLESSPTQFFAGAVFNPTAVDQPAEKQKTISKIKAGAKFLYSQIIFDPECLEDWKLEVPIIASIYVLNSAKTARFLQSKVPGVSLPKKIIDLMEKTSDETREGIAIAKGIIKELHGRVAGFHIISINREENISRLLEEAAI